MLFRPGMQRDRSKWRRSFGFSRSGFGGRTIWHLTRRRSRNAWCDITKRRPGGRLWCWLRQRLLGKDLGQLGCEEDSLKGSGVALGLREQPHFPFPLARLPAPER